MRAWRRSPFTNRFLLARCALLVLPVLLGLAAEPARARIDHLVAARAHAELELLLGRPVELGAVVWSPDGLVVRDVRVPRRSGEAIDPLVVPELRLAIDWTASLGAAELQVTRVRLQRPRLSLSLPESFSRARSAAPFAAAPVPVQLRSGTLAITTAAGLPLTASGIDAELRVEPARIRFRLHADRAGAGRHRLRDLELRGALTSSGVRVDQLELVADEGRLSARGAVDLAAQTPQLSASGRLTLAGGALERRLLPGLKLRARSGMVELEVRGPLLAPRSLQAEGQFALEDIGLQLPDADEPLGIRKLTGHLALAENRLLLSKLAATGRGFGVHGQLALAGDVEPHFEAKLVVELRSISALRQAFPRAPLWRWFSVRSGEPRGRVELVARGPASDGRIRAGGRFDVADLRLTIPDAPLSPVPIERASGSFEVSQFEDGPRLALGDVELRLARGSATAAVVLDRRAQRLELEASALDPKLLGGLLPGRLEGGSLSGTLTLLGAGPRPPAIFGHAEIVHSAWFPPEEAVFHETVLNVRRASGKYSVAGDRFEVSRLVVDGDRLTGRGRISGSSARVQLEARLRSNDAGGVMDAWPNLRGIARGGRGVAALRATWVPDGVQGTLQGHVQRGSLLMPTAAGAEHTSQPLARADFAYRFGPDAAHLDRLSLRGPQLNADLSVNWDAADHVEGGGRAWLTRSYASALAGPWKLPLVVLARFPLATRFSLRGTAAEVRLNAEIAHGARWRLLRLAVPPRLQAIARGETPIWRSESPANGIRL
jgi:hypothetical protein